MNAVMAYQRDPSGLIRDWSAFLKRDTDAQIIVSGLMIRTGLTEDEALFYLIGEWARLHSDIKNDHPANQTGCRSYLS